MKKLTPKNGSLGKFVLLISVITLGIGEIWYMNREKDLKELHDIQTDLANHLYNNYKLYTKNKNKMNEIKKAYNKGNGSLTEKEYLQKVKSIREYSDIEKIEFTGFYVGPMNTLKVQFTINDVLKKETSLDTVSAETNKWLYRVGEHDGTGPFYLEKKDTATTLKLPENLVVYYEGGIK